MTQILDPASEMEAEMAGAATACLVAALDASGIRVAAARDAE